MIQLHFFQLEKKKDLLRVPSVTRALLKGIKFGSFVGPHATWLCETRQVRKEAAVTKYHGCCEIPSNSAFRSIKFHI